jgi:hypothetical protein
LLAKTVQHDYGNTKAQRLIASGQFSPKIMDRFTPEEQKREMVGQFADLYSVFGYDEDDVEEILLNPANTIAYAQDETGVISTAMGEKATLEVEGFGQLHMAEITEAITHPDRRGEGFYAAICGFLTEKLKVSEEPLDIIYGESNLAMQGLLLAIYESGRRFSFFDRGKLGVRYPEFGILQQNFHVEDGTETRPYNDFALSYVPLDGETKK